VFYRFNGSRIIAVGSCTLFVGSGTSINGGFLFASGRSGLSLCHSSEADGKNGNGKYLFHFFIDFRTLIQI
jgi:hypothetical protein